MTIKPLAINSYRSPKPGSGYKHSTLPSSIRNGYSSVSEKNIKTEKKRLLKEVILTLIHH